MLPQFSILQKMYLGNIDYGGVYSSVDVKEYVFREEDKGKRDVLKPNATCMLRMSAVLNVTTEQPGSQKGYNDYYYFHKRDELLKYLKKMYGEPVESNKTKTFRGHVGIMFINITGSEASDDCSVLLWNGNGFHQGKGLLNHKDFYSAQLWAAPTAGCVIDVNVKQSGGTTCFPSKSQVELRSGKKIPISDLAIGDTVKTFTKNGEVVFSPVITFLDQNPDYKGHYYTITTEHKELTISEAHLIFKIGILRGPLGQHTCRSVHASQIKPGDYILVQAPQCKGPVFDHVIAVSKAERVGAFAPVTQEGTMIVDGVWVSCYADIADHDLADYLMTPLKSFYGWAPQMLGARGKYAHGYLKRVLRPIGTMVFGKDMFYQEPDNEVMRGKETVTSVFDWSKE
ncbi:tiggy-winkle hedgehog protein-like [Oculina patagonica]